MRGDQLARIVGGQNWIARGPDAKEGTMTPFRLAFACLLATMALSSTPSQAQTTRVRFEFYTAGDDLRRDSAATYEVELDDGRRVVGSVVGPLQDHRHSLMTPLDLPTGFTRDNIRFVRVHFGAAPGPNPKILFEALWASDQWEVRIDVGTQVAGDS